MLLLRAVYAKTLGGGRALQLSPCDLMPYIQGRTLWLLGCVAISSSMGNSHDCAGSAVTGQVYLSFDVLLLCCFFVAFRDSHTKSLYRALQCFLIDFWKNQAECEASTDAQAVEQLKKLPVADGDSQCIQLRGPAGGRICIVHVVLGTSLVNNKQVSRQTRWA